MTARWIAAVLFVATVAVAGCSETSTEDAIAECRGGGETYSSIAIDVAQPYPDASSAAAATQETLESSLITEASWEWVDQSSTSRTWVGNDGNQTAVFDVVAVDGGWSATNVAFCTN